MRRLLLILMSGAALGWGCSDSTDNATSPSADLGSPAVDGGVSSDSGQAGACASDDACPPGSVCDESSGQCALACGPDGVCSPGTRCDENGICVPRVACEDDSGCGAEYTCDCEGFCVPIDGRRCRGDLSCETTDYCDLCSGQCRERAAQCGRCTSDSQCDPRAVCVGVVSGAGGTLTPGFCARQCQGTCDVVGPNYRCDQVRDGISACVPTSGSCEEVQGCEVDADCPPDRFCNEQQRCQPGCIDDVGCPGGQLCQGVRCGPPCSVDGDCSSGQSCDPEGRCRVPGGCATSMDCPMAETFCDREQLMCVPGCEVDNDCLDANLECLGGTCRPRGCSGAFQCAFGQICDVETNQCAEPDGAHCETGCNPQSMEACGLPGSRCLSLQNQDGDPLGDFCFEACAEAPNECPKGYSCTEIMDEGGMMMGSLCIRDCTISANP